MFTCLVLWEYWYLVLRVFISKSFLVHPFVRLSTWQLFFEVEVGSLPTATLAPMIAIPKLSQKPWIIHTNCIAIVANLFFYISIELAPILGFLKLKLIIAIHLVIHKPEVPNLFINFEFIIIYALHEAFVHIWHVPYIMSLYNLGNVRITHFRVPQRWLSASRVVKGLVPLTSKNCIPTDKGYQKVAVIYQ